MNSILTKSIQAVTFFFAAFGGFFREIAPPTQTHSKIAVPLGSFLVLIVLLIISAVARHISPTKNYKKWIAAGCIFFILAVVSGVLYPTTLSRLTYYFPPPPDAPKHWRVKGLELTQIAKDFIEREQRQLGDYSPAELEKNLYYEEIWTARSLAKAKILLLANYLCLVLSISTAIFCLLEANSKTRRNPKRTKKQSTKMNEEN